MARDSELKPSGTYTFGEWLRRELDRAGLSQTELAHRMGASPGTISNWANGRRVPGAKSGPALAEALGVPPERVWEAAGRWSQAPDVLGEPERAALADLARTLPDRELADVLAYARQRMVKARAVRDR